MKHGRNRYTLQIANGRFKRVKKSPPTTTTDGELALLTFPFALLIAWFVYNVWPGGK